MIMAFVINMNNYIFHEILVSISPLPTFKAFFLFWFYLSCATFKPIFARFTVGVQFVYFIFGIFFRMFSTYLQFHLARLRRKIVKSFIVD